MSFLKKIGQQLGKILGFIANNAKPIADQAAAVAEVLMPQFAMEIAAADNLVTKIAKQAIVTEALAATASTAPTGLAKLESVVSSMSQEMDQWVANLFPGATQISAARKADLVNAVVGIVNDLKPATASSVSSTPAPVPPGTVTQPPVATPVVTAKLA
jgi:hypothetical protein